MKTLIFNGSPRKNGGTAALIEALRGELDGESTVISSYASDIAPCVDCRVCWTQEDCALADGMQEIYQKIGESDNIVIASPIYFAELTGSLLNLMSRLQFYWAARHMRGTEPLPPRARRGALLLADGGEGFAEPAMAMGKRLLRIMKAEFAGSVYWSGTDNYQALAMPPGITRQVSDLAAVLSAALPPLE